MEKQKMLAGALYDPLDDELTAMRLKARMLIRQFNDTSGHEADVQRGLLRQLIPNAPDDLWIQPPFYCDYGSNMTVGERVFFNFNCVVLDVAAVTIGSRTMFGPNVQLYTATHPVDHKERASGLESAKPVTIGDDVWIGGSVVVCPGVQIGSRTVIGAGSVVTQNMPSDVFAAGNPCRVIRQLT